MTDGTIRRARPWVWPTVATVVGLLTIAYFYRKFWTSGFALFQGDVGDGHFTALVTSHWADPLQFPGGLTDLGFFYPVSSTLGFSDAMLAFGFLTAPLMWLGVGAVPAFQWTLIVFTLVGYASTIAFFRLGPRTPWFLAIVAGVLVNASNGLFVSSGHPQLVAFSLAPVVLLGALLSARAEQRSARLAWAFGSGLLLGVVAYSAFYVGWFFVLGLSLTAAIAALIVAFRPQHRPPWREVAIAVVAGVAGFALVAPLFLVTYLPVLDRPRVLENVLYYALRPLELLNVSDHNLLWGRLLVEPHSDQLRGGEWMMAPTPVLVVAALAAAVVAIALLRRLDGWSILGLATVVAGFVAWLLPVDLNGFVAWRAVFPLPGAAAIRAIGRIELLAAMMFALGLVILVTQWWRSGRPSRAGHVLVIAVMLVIAFEQANARPGQTIPWEKLAALDAISGPPGTCTSFVLMPPFDPDRRGYEYAIDAVSIARTTGLPTWNGYSGDFPADWALMPDRPDYLDQVRLWQDKHHITNACGLRLADGTWLLPDMLDSMLAEATGR